MKPIITVDFETDPFEHERKPHPFCAGLYDGENFWSIWNRACARKLVKHLAEIPPSIIYMHNGGRFDIFFLFHWLDAEMRIINGRIVEAKIGHHIVRDSFAIFPEPLSAFKKDDIEIDHLRRENREQYRDEILSYLKGDCVYLWEIVTRFIQEFGDYLTIGSAAMAQLQKIHQFEHGNSYTDERIRSQFFFGGRVQCFKSGIINMPFKIYDVNSMYPFVMKNYMHPLGAEWELDKRVRSDSYFIVAEGRQCGSYGAFPIRNRNGGIDFNLDSGTFACTIHEWNVAEEIGWFKPTRIIKTFNWRQTICFDEFVDKFGALKVAAKKTGDQLRYLFYKRIQNSAYGKFSQNPDNFFDWAITHHKRLPEPWREHYIHERGKYVIWQKPVIRHSYYNVSIGASITGAARSILLRAIRFATDPIYCDTDSLICRRLNQVRLDDTELGAWKLEATGSQIAMAGKKLYACFDTSGECVKHATKGARITPEEIVKVANGETVVFKNDAPTFKLDGRTTFIKRRIRRTV